MDVEELLRGSHVSLFAQRLFEEPTGLHAFSAREALGFNLAVALGVDSDFDSLIQTAPPTLTVSLIDPLSSFCSTTE